MKNNLIFHIKAGGTINGCVPEYIEIEKVSAIFTDIVDYKKHIKETFQLKNDYDEIEICRKDSRKITDEDRLAIADVIKKQFDGGVRKFLITHGTYTMPDTAQYLAKNLEKNILESSMIIITGSMYPWVFYGSDAPMNIGASLSNLVQQETSGVFICMHGQRFEPDNVVKDVEGLLFKTIN